MDSGDRVGTLARRNSRRNIPFGRPLPFPPASRYLGARMPRLQAPRGTEDLLPERIPLVDRVFRACREVLERHGYQEIRTPLFEDTNLFVRSLGETTDIVEKEMFTVSRGETSVTFRPEGTASVVRAYLEHNLDKIRPFRKFYYAGPMFRYERPASGRQRQFDQIGIEAIGSSSPLLDAEVVLCAWRCFETLGMRNITICVNTLGDARDRDRMRTVLRDYMAAHLPDRCEDCRRRYERNVFRMLDCKEPSCRASNAAAPRLLDHVGEESRERFGRTMSALDALGVSYVVDHGIVRGLDYYTHLVFEVRCSDLGARDAVCGGGRYDGLVEQLGGPPLGAVGFAIGVTPTVLALERQEHPWTRLSPPRTPLFVAAVGPEQRAPAFLLVERLRRAGLAADTDYEDKSLKAQFKAASKRGARLVLVLGPEEVQAGTVTVRDLERSEDVVLAVDDGLPGRLAERLRA